MADINLGKLKVDADTSGVDAMQEKLQELSKGLPTVGEALQGMVKSLGEISLPAAAAVGAFVGLAGAAFELVSHSLEAATALKELSEATGISIENLQPLQEALIGVGGSADSLQQGARKLAQSVGKALADPTSQTAEMFNKLGISQKELATLPTDQLMEKVATALSGYADNATKAQVATALLGRGGIALAAQMAEAVPHIQDAKEQLQFWGAALDTATAKQMAEFSGGLKNLTTNVMGGLSNMVTENLLPSFQNMLAVFKAGTPASDGLKTALEGIATVLSGVLRAAMAVIIPVFEAAVLIIGELTTSVSTLGKILADIAHGDFKQAWSDYKDGVASAVNQIKDAVLATKDLEVGLFSTTSATQEAAKAADDHQKTLTLSTKGENAMAKAIAEATVKLAEAQKQYQASSLSVEAYTNAQAAAKAAEEAASKGGTAAQAQQLLNLTTATEKYIETSKANQAILKATQEMQAKSIDQTQQQTVVEKALAETQSGAYALADQALKQNLIDAAKKQELQSNQITLDKQTQTLTEQLAEKLADQTAAMRLTTQQLALYTAETKLRIQYEQQLKNIQNSSEPDDVKAEKTKQLTQAYRDQTAALQANAQATSNLGTSWSDGMAGATQAMNQFIENSKNLNKAFNDLTTQGINGFSTALVDAMNGGKDAFKNFELQMLKMIEEMIIKYIAMAVVAAFATDGASSASGAAAASSASSMLTMFAARGVGYTTMADGGLVNFPSIVAPGIVAGEMGNATGEAVVPLTRMADGELGVRMNGGGGGNMVNMTTINNITVHAAQGQTAADVASEAAKQVQQVSKVSDSRIANALRNGGMLNRHTRAAF